MSNLSKHHGSCLCGDVHFEVELDITRGSRCNCTLCTKLGPVGSVVKPAAFTLLAPESKLSEFTRTNARAIGLNGWASPSLAPARIVRRLQPSRLWSAIAAAAASSCS